MAAEFYTRYVSPDLPEAQNLIDIERFIRIVAKSQILSGQEKLFRDNLLYNERIFSDERAADVMLMAQFCNIELAKKKTWIVVGMYLAHSMEDDPRLRELGSIDSFAEIEFMDKTKMDRLADQAKQIVEGRRQTLEGFQFDTDGLKDTKNMRDFFHLIVLYVKHITIVWLAVSHLITSMAIATETTSTGDGSRAKTTTISHAKIHLESFRNGRMLQRLTSDETYKGGGHQVAGKIVNYHIDQSIHEIQFLRTLADEMDLKLSEHDQKARQEMILCNELVQNNVNYAKASLVGKSIHFGLGILGGFARIGGASLNLMNRINPWASGPDIPFNTIIGQLEDQGADYIMNQVKDMISISSSAAISLSGALIRNAVMGVLSFHNRVSQYDTVDNRDSTHIVMKYISAVVGWTWSRVTAPLKTTLEIKLAIFRFYAGIGTDTVLTTRVLTEMTRMSKSSVDMELAIKASKILVKKQRQLFASELITNSVGGDDLTKTTTSSRNNMSKGQVLMSLQQSPAVREWAAEQDAFFHEFYPYLYDIDDKEAGTKILKDFNDCEHPTDVQRWVFHYVVCLADMKNALDENRMYQSFLTSAVDQFNQPMPQDEGWLSSISSSITSTLYSDRTESGTILVDSKSARRAYESKNLQLIPITEDGLLSEELFRSMSTYKPADRENFSKTLWTYKQSNREKEIEHGYNVPLYSALGATALFNFRRLKGVSSSWSQSIREYGEEALWFAIYWFVTFMIFFTFETASAIRQVFRNAPNTVKSLSGLLRNGNATLANGVTVTSDQLVKSVTGQVLAKAEDALTPMGSSIQMTESETTENPITGEKTTRKRTITATGDAAKIFAKRGNPSLTDEELSSLQYEEEDEDKGVDRDDQ